jgi:hypothetical protein
MPAVAFDQNPGFGFCNAPRLELGMPFLLLSTFARRRYSIHALILRVALGNTPAHLTTSLVTCHEADTRRGGPLQLSAVQLEDASSCIALKAESPWSNACCYGASSDCSGELQRTSAPIWIRSSGPHSRNQQLKTSDVVLMTIHIDAQPNIKSGSS